MQASNLFLRQLTVIFFLFTVPLQAQIYVDGLLGILIYDDDQTASLDLAIGRQVNKRLGYGLNIRTMYAGNVSTTNTFSMLGTQYRVLDNKHRFYAKLEAGSLLSATYTTDGPRKYTYQRDFNPYYRIYLGHRFGRFTMGINYTHIRPFAESESEYDELLDEYVPNGKFRSRTLHNVQLHLGVSLDRYRVVKRKKK